MPTRRQLDPEIMTVFFPEEGQSFKGLNKFSNLSRWVIDDHEFDDLINFIPMGRLIQQVPANSSNFATLAATAVWISAQPLNQATYIFALCTNGAIYQVSLGGTITTVTGPGTVSVNTDIANWQGTTILFTDPNAAKIYSWNGTAFATVFSSQPEQFITVYAGRLWMANLSTIVFTNSGTFNSLGGDSGSFIITDSDCPPPIRALYPYGGNLYVFGYSWVKIYGGLYDSGSPPVLQFQSSTLTDEAGLINKWGVLPFGYSVFYPSLYGVWNLLGSQPVLMSDPVDQFFLNANVANSSYSAAYGVVLGDPCLMWHLQHGIDSTYRVLCMKYNPNGPSEWFTVSQGNITFITYGVNQATGQQLVWGTDTAGNLFQLFSSASTLVSSTVNTKLWSFGTRIREKSIGRAGIEMVVTGGAIVTLNAVNENLISTAPLLQSLNPSINFIWSNNNQTFNWNNSGPFTWQAGGTQYALLDFDLPIQVRKLGLNVTVQAAGATIDSFGVEFTELPADWGA